MRLGSRLLVVGALLAVLVGCAPAAVACPGSDVGLLERHFVAHRYSPAACIGWRFL